MLNQKILKSEELAALKLRSLYSSFGYSRFKMSKFEEYDLYVRNKDFLISEGIITFTDTGGKLLALKPDVTLSIIKNSVGEKAKSKLYYDENVYRISPDSKSFKEIAQTGIECIGDITLYDECEVLCLALKSLETIEGDFILDISHAGLERALLDSLKPDSGTRKKLVSAIRSKSRDSVLELVGTGELSEEGCALVCKLIANYGDAAALKAAFAGLDAEQELGEFSELLLALEKLGYGGKINIDFSIVSDQSYYSGVVFKGYLKGIPSEVLSGGRYDRLVNKMGSSSGAIGFAVYLDLLERHGDGEKDYDYDYIITLTSSPDAAEVIRAVERLSSEGNRVAVMKEIPAGISCRKIIDFKDLEGK